MPQSPSYAGLAAGLYGKKIHVIVDMSSVTGRLRRNFGAASGVTACAEFRRTKRRKTFGAKGRYRNFSARRREFTLNFLCFLGFLFCHRHQTRPFTPITRGLIKNCLGSSVPYLRLVAFGESMKSAKYEINPTRFIMCTFTLKIFKNALEVRVTSFALDPSKFCFPHPIYCILGR